MNLHHNAKSSWLGGEKADGTRGPGSRRSAKKAWPRTRTRTILKYSRYTTHGTRANHSREGCFLCFCLSLLHRASSSRPSSIYKESPQMTYTFPAPSRAFIFSSVIYATPRRRFSEHLSPFFFVSPSLFNLLRTH